MTKRTRIRAPHFADTDGSRLLMVFIAAWIAVVIALTASFSTATQVRAEILFDRLAHVAIGFAVCAGLALLITRLCLRDLWSNKLGYLLIAAMAIAGVGMAINLGGYCTFPGTWENPNLGEATDMAREWQWIACYKSTGTYMPYSNIGYTTIAAFAVDRLGPGISGPLLLNIMMLCGTLGCAATMAAILFPDRNGKKIAFYAALLTAAVASIIWYPTILLKETCVTFGVSLFGVALAAIYRHRMNAARFIAAALGAYLLMMVKGPIGWFLIAGILIVCARFDRKNPKRYLTTYASGLLLIILCGTTVIGGKQFRYTPDLEIIGAVEGRTIGNQQFMGEYATVERYSELIPHYFESPSPKRILQLPLTASAQFFPPFPWNYTRDTDEGNFVWYAHLSFLWYFVAGCALGFFVLCAWRKELRGGLGRWALWWVICYLGIAWFSGGTVARYYLPFIPCLAPLALRFLECAKAKLVSRRSVKIYAISYTALLCIGLTAAYIFLKL